MYSVVIPAFNEEKSISETIKRIHSTFNSGNDLNVEIIVVDDGSSDQTAKIAEQNDARVIHHPHNIGYGKSLKTGILNASYDTIIITDSDGTYPVESIPELLDNYSLGFDMVVGKRTGKHLNKSILKKLNRFILKRLVEFTTGRKIPDINSGLRVFSRKTILPFFDTLCNTFSFTTSLTLAYMMTGKFVKYIPIAYDKRVGKTKVKIFKDSLRTLQFIIEAILFYNPIKIFLVFTFIIILISVSNLVIAYFLHFMIAYIIGVGSLLLAIIVLGIGLLSIQLKQILIQKKNVQE